MARTVIRRAERSTWAAAGEHGDSVSPLPARYLNRLSDLLFILAREANGPGTATCCGSPAASAEHALEGLSGLGLGRVRG